MEHENTVIVRKRKKWKFAHFAAFTNCFELHELQPERWGRPLIVELGAGTADLTLALARQQPDTQFVAVDVKADRLYKGAKAAREQGLAHVAFVRAPAERLVEVFAPASVAELWLTFPDPFPRTRQAKHRLTHPQFLHIYQSLLAPGGIVRFKTDSHDLFTWSLEQIIFDGWQIRELSFDLHRSELPAEYKLTTTFERKFMAQNLPTHYVSFARP